MTRAAATTSANVSPLARSAVSNAAAAGAVNWPPISSVMKAAIVSGDKFSRLIN